MLHDDTNKLVDIYLYNLDMPLNSRVPKIYGQMKTTWSDAIQYLNALYNDVTLQKCEALRFTADLLWERHMHFIRTQRKHNCLINWSTKPCLTIKIDCCQKTNKNCSDCFDTIKNGKCTDPFVIEYVGKKFFADKYATCKQNTK